MLIAGKERVGFAMTLLAIAVLTLAIGAWAYFPSFEHVTVGAAMGQVSDIGHLGDLLFLQKAALSLVVVVAGLSIVALYFLHAEHEDRKRQENALMRQLSAFIRHEWQAVNGVGQESELGDLAVRLNAFGDSMRKGGAEADFEEVKSRFLEIISHQLRTPLTAVRWNLESLVNGELGRLRTRQEDLLRITSKNYQSILAMLSDWVEALEVERGLLRLNPEPVDLKEFMRAIKDEYKDQARLKRLRFLTRFAKDLPTISVDKLKLRYILSKLLSNAMGYTPERGRVMLRVGLKGDKIIFEVQDSGVGIPYEEQADIFKKFFRASNANLMQPNASGVGLFVTKILVEAHGGTIGFDSIDGGGTTFIVALPAAERRVRKPGRRSA